MPNVTIEPLANGGSRVYLDGHEVTDLVSFSIEAPVDGLMRMQLTVLLTSLNAGLGRMRVREERVIDGRPIAAPSVRQVELEGIQE